MKSDDNTSPRSVV